MNPAFKLYPIQRQSKFMLDEFLVWCGSMVRTPDGRCHLFFSRWPRSEGFEAWVTHSEIGYAVADDPLGPYRFECVTLRGSGLAGGWDRDVIHNPTVLYVDGKFYLYYTGNYGNGEYWDHRNHQRVGVAVADRPSGPWRRFDRPLLDVNPEGWDCMVTTNPSVTQMPDGRFIMVYKAVDKLNPAPFYGPVGHGVAFADSPLGPFVRHPQAVFQSGAAAFTGEDPFVFCYRGKLYTILKDMKDFYSSELRSLVLFESEDGIDWRLSREPKLLSRTLSWADGRVQEFYRLERPQLYFEDGEPAVFFGAVKPSSDCDDSYNIHFRVAADRFPVSVLTSAKAECKV